MSRSRRTTGQASKPPGGFFDHFRKSIPHQPVGICVGAQVFKKLAAAVGAMNERDQRFTPSTPLREVAGRRSLRTLLGVLEQRTGLKMPMLDYDRAPLQGLWPIVALFGVCTLVSMVMYDGEAALTFFALAVIAFVVTNIPAGASEPKGCDTFGNLARAVTQINGDHVARDYGGLNDHELWLGYCRIVAETLDIDPRTIRRDSHLIRDLGMN